MQADDATSRYSFCSQVCSKKKVGVHEKRSALQLPDDIKSRLLAETTKGPLEEHLVLNAAILRNCECVREEIQRYLGKRQNSELSRWTLTLSRRAGTAKEQVPKQLTCAGTLAREANGEMCQRSWRWRREGHER